MILKLLDTGIKDKSTVIFLCGWCGFPTNNVGVLLELGHDEACEYLRVNKDVEVVFMKQGTCCKDENRSVM